MYDEKTKTYSINDDEAKKELGEKYEKLVKNKFHNGCDIFSHIGLFLLSFTVGLVYHKLLANFFRYAFGDFKTARKEMRYLKNVLKNYDKLPEQGKTIIKSMICTMHVDYWYNLDNLGSTIEYGGYYPDYKKINKYIKQTKKDEKLANKLRKHEDKLSNEEREFLESYDLSKKEVKNKAVTLEVEDLEGSWLNEVSVW